MAAKRKPKFRVGQVVGFSDRSQAGFVKIADTWVGDAGRYEYEDEERTCWYESDLRPLTARERGERRKQ